MREFNLNSNQNSNIDDENQKYNEELNRMPAELSANDEEISKRL